jgi:Ankyrin repeats (3 copies)/Ankyrin repeats (many copies)
VNAYIPSRFLLARLRVESLLDKNTRKDVKLALQQFSRSPKTDTWLEQAYDEAYDDTIMRIEAQLPGKVVLAKKTLSWITYARRPLTTDELCHALAVEPNEDTLDKDNIPYIDDLVSVCSGLITITRETNIIRFVHYTTQEYFARIIEKWNPAAQEEITLTCLSYLSLLHFRSGSSPNDYEFNMRIKENVLLDYSAQYWGEHAIPVEEQVSKAALAFLKHKNLLSCAVQASIISESKYFYEGYSQNFPKDTTGLHLTARFGLLYLSEVMLSGAGTTDDSLADSRDSYGRTPLSLAARSGHESIVRLLVDRDDVEVDSRDSLYGQTPLSRAAGSGHESIVRLLVDRDDVEVDSRDSLYGQTPLSRAAGSGHESIVRLLVDRDDVEVDSRDGLGRTPLSLAAKRGHASIVGLLVDRDDVDSKGYIRLDREKRRPPSPPTTCISQSYLYSRV